MKPPDTPLYKACKYLARRVLSQSGAASSDVIETLADRFFTIAENHQDFVRHQRESDDVIEHAVRYLADVHALPPMGTDVEWFREAMNVLIELAVPNTGLTNDAAKLLPHVQEGIAQSLAGMPVPRSELRIDDEDAQLLKRFEEAGCEHGCTSDLLDLAERIYHGDPLSEEDRRILKLAALAAPITRHARESN
ncbi:hypothetical protein [Eleftheria terrae]|uniref:hypothetical protein n=1 Tax=Eleftheria terrae TaxID=1597781 RepID=UPI00263BA211|nr:hypothetical protein [Eleftheria terrae]WKB50555.1 hypothetical protein N7L95_00105 [Eleftheria terrae]